ncbi:MAG: hypothetical protein LBQ60_15025 [Bacteroidales bacterium]|jgi:hypothetical protein|nr:hypothetical protein [Bacteroidales bacterium]
MRFIIFISIFCFFSCTSGYSPEIEDVLQQAGSNRKELERVLNHYARNPEDSLMLRAAEFLIINMPGKYSEYFDAPWNHVATVFLRWSSSSDKQKVLETYGLNRPVVREDIQYITAEYLINNIDLAFKVWRETPWGRHVPFDVFCEEILPYRIGTEPLENWRELALASFADPYLEFLKDSLTTSVKACQKINKLLPRFRLDKDFPAMSYSQLMASARGPCDNAAALAIFSMRALGIPVTMDMTILWPHFQSRRGHSWNTVRDSDGNHISFMGAETNPYQPHQGTTFLKSKAYRRMFSNQYRMKDKEQNIPPEFMENLKDISSEHSGMVNIKIPVKYPPEEPSGNVYLTTCHEREWHPVAYGTTDGKSMHYGNIGYGIVYWPVYYQDHRLTSANDPFSVDKEGNIRWFSHHSPDTLLTIVEELHKNKGMLNFLTVEAANYPDFSDATQLYAVKNLQVNSGYRITIPVYASYRYVRFKSSQTGFCNKAKFVIYEKENKPRSSSISSHNGDWQGFGYPEKKEISTIYFTVEKDETSDLNGFIYELFSFTENGWTSVSDQYIKHNTQIKVPSKSIYYLRNVALGLDEPMFVIKDGKPALFHR